MVRIRGHLTSLVPGRGALPRKTVAVVIILAAVLGTETSSSFSSDSPGSVLPLGWVIMPSCCVPDCWNDNKKQECHHLSWFRFPLGQNQKGLLRQWLARIGRVDFVPTSASRVCSAHFEENSFQVDLVGQLLPEHREGKRARRLKADAVPTLFARNEQSALDC